MEEDQREGRSRTTPQKRPHRLRTADHRRQPDRGPRPRTMRQTHTRQIPDPAGRQGQSHPHQRQRRKRVRRRQARPIHQPGDPRRRTLYDRTGREAGRHRIHRGRGPHMAARMERARRAERRIPAGRRPVRSRRLRIVQPQNGRRGHRTGRHGKDDHHARGGGRMARQIRSRQRPGTGDQPQGRRRTEEQHRMQQHHHRQTPLPQRHRPDRATPTRHRRARPADPVDARPGPKTRLPYAAEPDPRRGKHLLHPAEPARDHRRGRHGRHQAHGPGIKNGRTHGGQGHPDRRPAPTRQRLRSRRHARLDGTARHVSDALKPVAVHLRGRQMGRGPPRRKGLHPQMGRRGTGDARTQERRRPRRSRKRRLMRTARATVRGPRPAPLGRGRAIGGGVLRPVHRMAGPGQKHPAHRRHQGSGQGHQQTVHPRTTFQRAKRSRPRQNRRAPRRPGRRPRRPDSVQEERRRHHLRRQVDGKRHDVPHRKRRTAGRLMRKPG